MTYQEAQEIVQGWREIPAVTLFLDIKPEAPFCPADGETLDTVEDIEGGDTLHGVLAVLYRCPECGWMYYHMSEWGGE